MKRRDFLVAGAALTGGLGMRSAFGQAKPCPPGTFGVSGGSQVTSACVDAGTGPAWIRSLSVGAWSTIANGSGSAKTLSQVVYGNGTLAYTTETGASASASARTIFEAWTGATVDIDRKEYLTVANGGHGDYCGNEAYALALWADAPYWYRLNDPSPPTAMQLVPQGPYPGDGIYAKYLDGRARASHNGGTLFHVPGTGKVWFSMQNSFTSGGGGSGFGNVSFNREFPGMATSAGQAPLAWANNAGPWEFHSEVGSSPSARQGIGSYYFGLGAYDASTKKIWSVGGTNNGVLWTTDPFNNGASQNFVRAGGFPQVEPGFFAACPDRGVLIRGGTAQTISGRSPYEISIFNLATKTWVDKLTGPGANFPFSGVSYIAHGGVYYDGAIYVMDPHFFGPKIFKLTLPTDLSGDWSRAWSVIEVAGGPPSTHSAGLWGRMQLVTFGSAAALVLPVAWDQATYVFRLS